MKTGEVLGKIIVFTVLPSREMAGSKSTDRQDMNCTHFSDSSKSFVPVPRTIPRDGKSTLHAADQGLPDRANASPLERWLAESFEDQPFHVLAAVQRVAQSSDPAPESGKGRSSVRYLRPN